MVEQHRAEPEFAVGISPLRGRHEVAPCAVVVLSIHRRESRVYLVETEGSGVNDFAVRSPASGCAPRWENRPD